MKKLFKALTCLSIACAVTASAAAFAACGGDDKGDDKGGNKTQTTVSYQCLGFTDELVSSFSSFDFMGNLLSDGTGTIYRYEKTGTTPVETSVTWKVEQDRDGLTMLTLDDDIEDPFEVYMDEDTQAFELEYRFAFAGTYHRNVKLTVSSKVTYNSVDDFKKASDERRKNIKPINPDDKKEAVVTFDGGEGNSIEFYADNTAKISAFGGQMKFDYTWKLENDVITLTSKDNPSETMASVKEGNTYKFSYSASFLGGQTLTFTCDDISKLTVKTAVVTFAGGEGNSIKFYADKTAVLSAYNGAMNFDYTWTLENDIITLASKEKPDEKMTSVKEGNTYKFSYTAAFLGGQTLTFTCDDISALK